MTTPPQPSTSANLSTTNTNNSTASNGTVNYKRSVRFSHKHKHMHRVSMCTSISTIMAECWVFLCFFFIISFWNFVITSGQLGRGGSGGKFCSVFITVGETTNGFWSVIDAQQDLWCLLMHNCNYIKMV
jgi:hypothetical protein